MATKASNQTSNAPDIKTLRDAIPAHCFRAKPLLSFAFIVRDVAIAALLVYLALNIQFIENWGLRCALWGLYGVTQGFVFTGVWILAHECGHKALFNTSIVNNSLGFVLHSMLLVPYFSWKYSHARHHRYTNNMDKDMAFVPAREETTRAQAFLAQMLGIAEDSPALNIALFVGHQLVGWPVYILFAITSNSEAASQRRNSHLDPFSDIFTKSQQPYIFISDLGLGLVAALLLEAGKRVGWSTVALLYLVPWLWVNHWIVAITYLHHTHPDAKHYENAAWTFQDGALATVDRDFGFVGDYLFHGIIEYHVIHHLFPRIPFYHAREATDHIQPLLGKRYLHEETNFLRDLWSTFTTCKYVVPSSTQHGVFTWARVGTGGNRAVL